jgi:hypothetical protein
MLCLSRTGVGFAHLGAKGRALVGAALELGLRKSFSCVACASPLRPSPFAPSRTANYQEYLGKCVMINTPWVFNTFWYFVKGFLDEE